MERLLAWWNPPAPALRLAVLRCLVGAYALIYSLIRAPSFASVAAFHDGEFRPVGVARLLTAPLPPALVYASVALAIASGVLFVLGARFRWSGPAFAAAFLWVTTYRSSWAMIFHTDNLVALHLIVLAWSPAAQALSWDARHADASAWKDPDERYGWAIRIMAVATACAYVVAGVAKLKLAGMDWLGGELLRQQIAFDNLRKIELGSTFSPIGVWLVRHPAVFAPLAVATMFIELGAPAALANRRIALGWSVAAWCFHVGIVAMMNIGFPYQLSFVAYLPLFRVERLLELGPVRRLTARFQLGAVNSPSTPV
jgi:hypothetical protein